VTRTPAPTGEGANFRETLWFKKGDVDQMVADARAKVAAIAAQKAAEKGVALAGEPEVAPEDAKPLEDRYVDDGTVTVEDRKKFSLGSGGTSTAMPARGGGVPGERMSENEMLGEIGGGKRFVIIGIVVAVAVALIAVVVVSMRGKGKDQEAPKVEQAAPAPVKPAAEPKAAAPAAEEGAPSADEKVPAAEKADVTEKAEKAEKTAKAPKAEAVEAKPEPSPKPVKKKVTAKKKTTAAAKKKK
jgi:hypothetical protein